jgi:hypothetical protein
VSAILVKLNPYRDILGLVIDFVVSEEKEVIVVINRDPDVDIFIDEENVMDTDGRDLLLEMGFYFVVISFEFNYDEFLH